MNVGVLIITHPGIATALLNTARNMLGQCCLQTAILEVPLDAPLDDIRQKALAAISRLDQGDGVLLLCDIFGSTPCNVARALDGRPDIRLVSGINLPMLVRVLNYGDLNLNELATKAISGGRDGIVLCGENRHG
ncbi:MAG: mannose system component [Pseudomonadota bacterium]|nr:mannose system component [Pseudomonadota bacterium]